MTPLTVFAAAFAGSFAGYFAAHHTVLHYNRRRWRLIMRRTDAADPEATVTRFDAREPGL